MLMKTDIYQKLPLSQVQQVQLNGVRTDLLSIITYYYLFK